MDPTIGRIVHYHVSSTLVRPAIITHVFEDCVNLQVFLDGFENDDSKAGLMLETSVSEGDLIGQWSWPALVNKIEGKQLPLPGTEVKNIPDMIEGVSKQIEKLAHPPIQMMPVEAKDVKGYILMIEENMPMGFMQQLKAQAAAKFNVPIMAICGTRGSLHPIVGPDAKAEQQCPVCNGINEHVPNCEATPKG